MQHATPATTIGVYMKQIPEEVKSVVEAMGEAWADAIGAGVVGAY